jgi:serine/threonine-protein kinase
VVHRDIKPENVMIVEGADGSAMAKLVDFGIAKLGQHETRDKRLTGVGVVFGTPEYMAPEQALGSADVDERADLYAVGVILRGLLTGRPLFVADDGIQLLELKLSADPPPLRRVCPGAFSNELQQVVAKALARKPSSRFASANEFLAAVEAVQGQPGGGLASGGASTWIRLVGKTQSVGDLYRDWYACSGQGTPGWSTRLRALATTVSGRVVAGTALAVVAALLALALALPGDDEMPPPPDEIPIAEPGNKRRGRTTPARRPDPTARRLGQARLLLAKYSCREASLDLKNLVRQQPKLAKAHYLLGAALICRKLHQDGLQAYGRAIELDSRYRADARILEDAERLFSSRSRRLRLAALEFLSQRIGKPARKPLVEACTHRDQRTREAAVAAVIEMGAEKHVDWIASYELDLKQLSCREAKRRKLVQRLTAFDDQRVLPILKRARGARAGFLGLRKRYACLRKELTEAIEELEED